jgi:hypothetical protein
MVEDLATMEEFSPIFVKLGNMVGAARDAFNRHSGASLEQLKTLHGELTTEIKSAGDDFGALAAKAPENQRLLMRLRSVLTHLLMVGDNLEALANPIGQKNEGRSAFF